jgi:hypothetical protein
MRASRLRKRHFARRTHWGAVLQHFLAFQILWRNEMSKFKLLSAGLIAAAMLTTPVMAREHHPNARHVATDADASADGGRYRDWQDGNAVVLGHAAQMAEPDAYRYHGGPKSND